MTYSMKDVEALTSMVMEEQGDNAVTHVSNYIDQLRVEKDMLGAGLWTMVLALLYHHAQPELPARQHQSFEINPDQKNGEAAEPASTNLSNGAVTLH